MEWGWVWTFVARPSTAHRQKSLCHWIVDQVGIVDQGVKQVKAGEKNFTAEAQTTQRELERFPFGCLALK